MQPSKYNLGSTAWPVLALFKYLGMNKKIHLRRRRRRREEASEEEQENN